MKKIAELQTQIEWLDKVSRRWHCEFWFNYSYKDQLFSPIGIYRYEPTCDSMAYIASIETGGEQATGFSVAFAKKLVKTYPEYALIPCKIADCEATHKGDEWGSIVKVDEMCYTVSYKLKIDDIKKVVYFMYDHCWTTK